jgi:hypothetical protein
MQPYSKLSLGCVFAVIFDEQSCEWVSEVRIIIDRGSGKVPALRHVDKSEVIIWRPKLFN